MSSVCLCGDPKLDAANIVNQVYEDAIRELSYPHKRSDPMKVLQQLRLEYPEECQLYVDLAFSYAQKADDQTAWGYNQGGVGNPPALGWETSRFLAMRTRGESYWPYNQRRNELQALIPSFDGTGTEQNIKALVEAQNYPERLSGAGPQSEIGPQGFVDLTPFGVTNAECPCDPCQCGGSTITPPPIDIDPNLPGHVNIIELFNGISPIILDLDGNGVETTNVNGSNTYFGNR